MPRDAKRLRIISHCTYVLFCTGLGVGWGEVALFPHPPSRGSEGSRTSKGLLRRWEVWLPLLPEVGFAEALGRKIRTPPKVYWR